MSESALPEIRELANAAPAPAPAIVVVNAGALIRAERERQGLHIAALAFTLKVPQAKLEALEANRFDLLSDTVFLRALASSICRILKIDANLILSNLPKPAVQAMNTSPASLNTPFQSGRVQFFDKLKIVVTKPWGIGVLLMLLLIFATLFLPSISSFGDLSPVPSSTQAPLASPTLASSEPLAPSSSAFAPAQPEAGSVVIESLRASTAVTPAVVAEPVLSPVDALNLRAQGSAWVEVVDAKATVLLRRHMGAGETVLLQGFLPISVVLGRADLMTVKVHGQGFDVRPWSNNNVARFEVN